MPVRSLHSSVFKWPDRQGVVQALTRWADSVTQNDSSITRIGYFGSCARGDWGVGTDLDLLILVAQSDRPFEQRATRLDLTALPVPAEALVYTEAE